MKIDLHGHSNRSDGTDTPRQLVRKASAQGITVLVITDHDTTTGWSEAAEAALQDGVHLVRGLELSVKNEGRSQHLLAYEPDPNHPALVELLRRARVVREARIPLMVERIAATVPKLRWEDVKARAQGASPGRCHIADALVSLNVCRDRDEAFKQYLVVVATPTWLGGRHPSRTSWASSGRPVAPLSSRTPGAGRCPSAADASSS